MRGQEGLSTRVGTLEASREGGEGSGGFETSPQPGAQAAGAENHSTIFIIILNCGKSLFEREKE